MTLTHTIKRAGGTWQASMGGLGTVAADPVINVRWNDAAETALRVTSAGAVAWHRGQRYELKPVAGDLETVAAHWIAAITARLQAKRLQGQVRAGWQSPRPSAA